MLPEGFRGQGQRDSDASSLAWRSWPREAVCLRAAAAWATYAMHTAASCMHQVLACEVRVGGVGEKAPPGLEKRRMARDV